MLFVANWILKQNFHIISTAERFETFHTMRFNMLILVLAFTTLSLKIYADFLKRLAPEVQLINELYKTTRHIESSESDSVAIVNQVFPRYANQMWTEGMIVNSADEQ
ncbi:MAG: hypothetical protein P8Y42_09275, partial [Exilibacterium sp.]